VIAVLGFFAVRPNSYNYEGLFSSNSLDNKAQQQAFNSVTKKDSDEDGLKDWEEELWGTDPNNKDTDADGTNDGDEINQNRNPLKAGPNDVLDDNELITIIKDNNSYDKVELTTTDKFAQDFFQEYLSLKGSGAEIDEYSKALLIESTISDALDTDNSLIGYTRLDLNVSNDISSIATKSYGNTLGNLILKNSPDTENEIDIFNRAVANEDEEEIKKLDPIISAHKNIVKEMLIMIVPKDIIDEHIDLIENVTQISKYIESMRAVHSDPVLAIVGIDGYKRSILVLDSILESLENYFINKGIVFNEDEEGSIFLNNI